MSYYLIVVVYTPYMCGSITENIVISESVADFIYRTRQHMKENYRNKTDMFVVTQWMEISEREYLALLPSNPAKYGSYVRVSSNDVRKSEKDLKKGDQNE